MKFLLSMELRFVIARFVLVLILSGCAFLAYAVGEELVRTQEVLERAGESILQGKTEEAATLLARHGERTEFAYLVRFGVFSQEEFFRRNCAATLLAKKYERAVEVCTAGEGQTQNPDILNELRFNLAVAHIQLLGSNPDAHGSAKGELSKVLRTTIHSRAAELLERLNLFPPAANQAFSGGLGGGSGY